MELNTQVNLKREEIISQKKQLQVCLRARRKDNVKILSFFFEISRVDNFHIDNLISAHGSNLGKHSQSRQTFGEL
jgi:ribosomal protein L4